MILSEFSTNADMAIRLVVPSDVWASLKVKNALMTLIATLVCIVMITMSALL